MKELEHNHNLPQPDPAPEKPPARPRSLEAANLTPGANPPAPPDSVPVSDDPPLLVEDDSPAPEADDQIEETMLRRYDELFDWVRTVVVTCVCVLISFLFVFRLVTVYGSSMEPTLREGDRLVSFSLFYQPKYGDIVAITKPNTRERNLIKRVIATEGQTVDIDFSSGEVFVDGERLEEDFILGPTTLSYDMTFPATVPEGSVFVLGDNRNGSWDSRAEEVGMIDARYLMGTASLRLFPFTRIGFLNVKKTVAP